MTLKSTQLLTETCTRNTSWEGKGGRCIGLTNLPYHFPVPTVLKFGNQNTGTPRACPGLYGDCFTFTFSRQFTYPAVISQNNLFIWKACLNKPRNIRCISQTVFKLESPARNSYDPISGIVLCSIANGVSIHLTQK